MHPADQRRVYKQKLAWRQLKPGGVIEGSARRKRAGFLIVEVLGIVDQRIIDLARAWYDRDPERVERAIEKARWNRYLAVSPAEVFEQCLHDEDAFSRGGAA